MDKIKINKAYQPLYTSNKRYFLVTGGRGSLKSTTVHDFISRLTFERGHGILFTRYTMASAEKSIIPEFIIVSQRNRTINSFIITRDKIVNKHTGSFIIFSGIKTSSGDQTANLKSIAGITTWVIDEGEDFNDEKKFDDIDNSIRSKEIQNRIIWIQNPTTPEHFVYKRWIQPKNKQINIEGYDVTVSDCADVEHIHTTYHIAKEYLNQSFIDKAEALRLSSPKKYYHTFVGGWLEKAEGCIFDNWHEGEFDESLPYIYGQDYGFSNDPTTLIRVAVDEKKKIVYAEELMYSYDKMGVEDLYRKNSYLIKKANDLIVGDSAEDRLIYELKNKGLNIIPCQKFPDSVRTGIAMLQDYKIIITKDSNNFKIELNNYIWNDKKSGIPIDKYNHICDPLRYTLLELTRSKFYFA